MHIWNGRLHYDCVLVVQCYTHVVLLRCCRCRYGIKLAYECEKANARDKQRRKISLNWGFVYCAHFKGFASRERMHSHTCVHCVVM